MMSDALKRRLCLAIAVAIFLPAITGCSKQTEITTSSNIEITATAITASDTAMSTPNNTEAPVDQTTQTEEPALDVLSELTSMQRNSISMLNYLTVLTQEINSSSNSKLYLERANSAIYNNTYPNAVDDRTLGQLGTILDTIEKYRMTSVKRERLEYIYEQNQAQAIRNAIPPNPLGLISAVQSKDMLKLAASIVYMAVDSISSYQSSVSQAEMQYLQGGWALDNDAAEALHSQRKSAFTYMIRTVNENSLPGDLALTEEAVENFVTWKNNTNVVARIRFLESNQSTYRAFGGYWLLLAQSYYDHEDYDKCLEAVTAYESLDIGIFRKDFDYAAVLPLAITSADRIYDRDKYATEATRFAEAIINNTGSDQWALRYFAAQTYVNLYGITKDSECLRRAYDITLDNVNALVPEQRTLNANFMAPVVDIKPEAGATKAQTEEINSYNKMQHELRKTELAPISEPLLVNLELLFSLSTQMKIGSEEQERIDEILHEQNEALFLNESVDQAFRFTSDPIAIDTIDASFDGKQLIIPAKFVAGDTSILVIVNTVDDTTEFTDWKIQRVDRKQESDLGTFTAVYTSEAAGKFTYVPGMSITVTIQPKSGFEGQPLSLGFETITEERWWIIPDGIKFQRTVE